ncbi:MAG: CcmD family protein [Candidatus Binataceae bacterium]|nr:CcmD family protein [Candidatus Binataceae bacterium]
MENFGYLFAAYTIIFAVIFIYVMFIWRRQQRLEEDLRGLSRRVDEVDRKAAIKSAS